MLTVRDQREEGIYDDSQNSHFHLCISSYDIQKVEQSPEEDEHFVFKEMTVKKKGGGGSISPRHGKRKKSYQVR